MNEYAILMKLLTRSGVPIGASVEDMLDALGFPEDSGRHILFQRLGALHKRLSPVGLLIKHNPMNHVFYLDTSFQTDILSEETPLPDRLAATLLVVITLAYQEGGWVSVDRVREFRRKSKRSVMEDVRDLTSLSYLEIDDQKKKIRPGMKVAFEIDYESFFRRLSESPTTE